LKQWLEGTMGRKSNTAMAGRYALGRWEALLRYVDDDRLEIDNNAAERALRTVALGRKNYLFASFDAGGERGAAIYILIGTPSSMTLTQKATCGTCSPVSPIIPSTASRNCSPGTSLQSNLSH
jgi:hypothetical protein